MLPTLPVGKLDDIPVFREDAHCRGVVGTVGDIQVLHLGHQREEAASDPLLSLRHPADTTQAEGASGFQHTELC